MCIGPQWQYLLEMLFFFGSSTKQENFHEIQEKYTD